MRAAVCREFGASLSIEEVAIAEPGPEDVLIDVSAVAICHSDIAYIDGAWGGKLPAVFGHEAAGTVSRVGDAVTEVAVGDPVAVTLVRSCGRCFFCRAGNDNMCEQTFSLEESPPLRAANGEVIRQGLRTAAFAERVVVHHSQVARLPADIAVEAAALLACGVITGFGAVTKTAQVPAGSSVVVVGTGGVGLNCIQGAVYAKAEPIIAVDLQSAKLDLARRLGATHTINPGVQEAAAAVAELTEGRGADYVFVAVGSSRAVEQSLALLRRAGSLIVVGMPPTGDFAKIDLTDFADNSQRILGSKMGSVHVAADVPMLAELYRSGDLALDELITRRYSFDEINEAVDSARRGEAVRNVIVFG